jgi:hypothetical protein
MSVAARRVSRVAARLAVWMPGSREDARSGMGGSASRNNEEDRTEMP